MNYVPKNPFRQWQKNSLFARNKHVPPFLQMFLWHNRIWLALLWLEAVVKLFFESEISGSLSSSFEACWVIDFVVGRSSPRSGTTGQPINSSLKSPQSLIPLHRNAASMHGPLMQRYSWAAQPKNSRENELILFKGAKQVHFTGFFFKQNKS